MTDKSWSFNMGMQLYLKKGIFINNNTNLWELK